MQRKLLVFIFSVSIIFSGAALFSDAATSPVGIWKTVDDKTGDALSYVEIYEKGGKMYGKIVKLLKDPPDSKCDKCKGNKKNKPIIGLEILWNLPKDKKIPNKWGEGRILDPDDGQVYRVSIELKNSGKKLKVRGYIWFFGSDAAGRTQYWYRVK